MKMKNKLAANSDAIYPKKGVATARMFPTGGPRQPSENNTVRTRGRNNGGSKTSGNVTSSNH